MEWISKEITETIFESYKQIIRLHSHGNRTELVWGDPPCTDDEKPAKKPRKKKSREQE